MRADVGEVYEGHCVVVKVPVGAGKCDGCSVRIAQIFSDEVRNTRRFRILEC